MKNSESIQLVKEQLQIKSIELRKIAENNTTINNKIKTLITENQDEVTKLKTTISKKDEEIQQREKIIRTTSDNLKKVQESAKEQVPSQVIDPKIIEKIKALKIHTDKLNKKIKSEQEFNKKFEKEKSILLKEIKRLKKDEGKTDELFKRVEQYKKKLADAENSTNEVDESLQKLIKEKDLLIKKLKVTISKSNKDVGIPEELLKIERFEGMKPVEIMLALKEDVAKMEKDRKKVKKRFESLKEDNETLEMKLNAALADSESGGSGEINSEARSAASDEFGGGLEAFLLTYADMITLLLVIFVMMYTASNIDQEKFAEAMSSFQDKVMKVTSVNVRLSQEEMGMLKKIRELVKDNIDPNSLVRGDTKTILFKIPSSDLFGPGSAKLVEGASKLILTTIQDEMKDGVKQVIIDGHTDNVPTKTAIYPSNWELSSARASSVARFIIEKMRYPAKLLVVSGYGSERPVKPNSSDDNRASNRRVEIKIMKDKNVAAAEEAKRKSDALKAENKAAGYSE
jgi:chemotaxis protein MotB|tara:strand:- start:1229 stop:2770 length:1542 start_codon:yes stop_codon:yes gene_type:complete